MARFFTSFEEAWSYFLTREEPLEDFLNDFPDDPQAIAEGWIFEPSEDVKDAVLEVQRAFAHLSWIRPIPRHFLHVWLVGLPIVDLATRLPLELDYRCVNCFHSAVVVQVRAPALVGLHPEPTFLPHMTIGVTMRPHPPAPLRTAIRPLRDVGFGRQRASEAKRISFPAGRRTVLQPWTVVDVVPRPRAR